MKVLVTGASGFIGSHVVRQLEARDHDVLVVHRNDENKIWESDLYEKVIGDIHTARGLISLGDSFFPEIDAVCHLEAETNTTKPWIDYIEPNIATPLSLYAWAKKRGCRKFVWASSAAVYGADPESLERGDPKYAYKSNYGRSKWRMEQTLSDIQVADRVFPFLRLCNVYGPGEGHKVASGMESMVRQILIHLLLGAPAQLFGDGEQSRQWVHVEDAARAFVVAAESDGPLESPRIISGLEKGTSFNELVALCGDAIGVVPKIEYIDIPDDIRHFQSYKELPDALAFGRFNWKPQISLVDGIRSYAEHLKETL